MPQVIQCVPNFSEGRRPEVIAAIVEAIKVTPGVRLADWSADPDHHRMVVTFLGGPEAVRAAALATCVVALETIDLRVHSGVHPRLGALDVLPFVPISGITLAECAQLARDVGQELALRHDIPVFLYEAAVSEANAPRALPFVRREAFRSLSPDFGPAAPHPTPGAIVIGARLPLIAYNVNLATPNIRIARKIAAELREGSTGGILGVRALGLALPSRSLTQVSMNITRPAETSLLTLFTTIARRAAESGTQAIESEVIGALPGYSAFDLIRESLQAISLKPGQILQENWPQML